ADTNLGIQKSTFSGDSLISDTDATVDTTAPATFTIKYNATDSAGNKAVEVTRTVIVETISEDAETIIPPAEPIPATPTE
ncbi:MAG TPA: DUF5011 domain-containing protein, partial [Candidatus Paceibacterota bacterium]|nr:DUF5011 domain-containing protein [Candidatus Paceibacterota bacterium]